jgi:CheY-like chemotaxis protein
VPIRCLIVDDNGSFLEVASALLEQQGLSVVGVASGGAEALRQFETLRPEIVLVDIFLGHESGLELAGRLVEAGAAVIFVSTHAEADVEALISGRGAVGFLPKAELSARAILRIMNGRLRRT